MNPHYQLLMAQGYSSAEGLTESTFKLASPIIRDVLPQRVSESREPATYLADTTAIVSPNEPTTTTPTAALDPILEPITALANEPITQSGDSLTEIKDGTTINIFSPDGTLSKTSTAETVTVDPTTGEISTSTSGGGGGGGGGMMGGGDEGVVAKAKKLIKTTLPLLVMAAGIGVIIFRPLK